MDPISASCLSIDFDLQGGIISDEKNSKLNDIIISCRSLSYYESKSFKAVLPQVVATLIAASFHIVLGISFAYSAILIPQLMEAQDRGDEDAIQVTKAESAWIASCLPVVVPAGAFAGGFLMDRIGRLNLLKLTAIPSVLGWVLIATATNVPSLLAGRMLTGIASAWASSPAVVYITEIASVDMRGTLVTTAPVFISVGMVLGYLKGWIMNWRLAAWLCIGYSIIPVFLIMFIPESPPWLVSKGRNKEAKKSLEWLHRHQPQPERKMETYAEMQLVAIEKLHILRAEEQERTGGNTVANKLKLLIQPNAYKPFLIMSGMFFFQQFSGIFIILFYGVNFFKDVGTDVDPYLASVFLGVTRLVMSIVNAWMMKKYKRRKLYFISAIGMAICMGISGLYTKWIHEGVTTQNWIPVSMLLVYVLFSMLGVLPLPFTMTAELFPLSVRGIGHSAVFSVANLLMFAAVQSYYTLHQLFGGSSGLQYFFALLSLAALVYSFAFLPETYQTKLSDIEEYFLHHTTYLSVPSTKNLKLDEKNVVKQYQEKSEKIILKI